ncbi:transmembrane protein 222 isoform X2 [Bos javanicus]|uniref:transmembrane protein 222 isoform X2 n=1 Tax=Bos javanicus TaxID=9906 RepID=UPI002AA757DE|nr:transmembrane protein 222 isoform X2 [Bos javanicus]
MPSGSASPPAQRHGAGGRRAQRNAAPIPGGKPKPGGPHLREVTPPPSERHWSRGWAGRAHAAWRKRKGVRRSCCRRRCLPRSGWRKWRRRRRPRRTRSNLAVLAAAPWTWSGAASPTAWCGRPSRCSRGFSPSSATWASAHPQESFGTLLAPTLCRKTTWPLGSLPSTGSWTPLRSTPAGPTRGTPLCTTPLRSTSTACTISAVTTATRTWPWP